MNVPCVVPVYALLSGKFGRCDYTVFLFVGSDRLGKRSEPPFLGCLLGQRQVHPATQRSDSPFCDCMIGRLNQLRDFFLTEYPLIQTN